MLRLWPSAAAMLAFNAAARLKFIEGMNGPSVTRIRETLTHVSDYCGAGGSSREQSLNPERLSMGGFMLRQGEAQT
jgi:hypothetical protein